MVRRHTRVLAADAAGIAAAAAILRAGGLVAFPTETVYGLGAHALDAQAVQAIFDAKERPADDPLIVHVGDARELTSVGVLNPAAQLLGGRFWPGPLTLVVRKLANVPPGVTAGLETVGVRVPAHPLAQELLRAARVPIAAPSANLFGRPSPTRAQHVLDDLRGRIDAVLDGGPTSLGVESTIVDVSCVPPRLLRPGGVAAEEIEAALGVTLPSAPQVRSGPQTAPGQLPMHYSPRTPLTLIAGPPDEARHRLLREVEISLAAGRRVGVLALDEDLPQLASAARVEVVGSWGEPATAAKRLFEAMRALDAANLDLLLARDLADPRAGLGRALADRLRRAARSVIDSGDENRALG